MAEPEPEPEPEPESKRSTSRSPSLNNGEHRHGPGSAATGEKAPVNASAITNPPPLFVVPSDPQPQPETEIVQGQDQAQNQDLERHTTTATDGETYPEGGLQAWLVVFGAWLALVSSFGVMNTVAVFQEYVAAHQLAGYNSGAIGWIFSIYMFCVCFLGLYIGPLFDKYGPRWLILTGTISLCASLMLFSISTGKLPYHPDLFR